MKSSIIATLKQIKFLIIPYLVILTACVIIELLCSRESIYFTVNGWHFAAGDVFFEYYTNMGGGATLIILSLLIAVFNYRKGFLMASSFLLTALVAQSLKRIFDTPRPVLYFKDHLNKLYLVKGVDMLDTLSFPSGHSTSAFSIAVVLAYITPKKHWGLLYLALAILVGYSRMYLSEHFFEDVVGGSVIGVFVTAFWVTWIDNRAFIQSPKWNKGLINLKK